MTLKTNTFRKESMCDKNFKTQKIGLASHIKKPALLITLYLEAAL